MDVMMRLPSSSLDVLRNKFMSSAGGDGLILEEFVDAMLHYLPKPANEEECIKLVMELVDLYHQVDVNGDCFMSWDEFTSHCIEAGMLATRTVEKPLSVNFQYIPDFKDPLNHHIVQEVQLIESLNAILVIESGSSAVKIIDATTLKLERILQVRRESTNGEMENHRFPIVSLVYAHDLQLLAICSADMSISFWTWDDFRSLGHIQSKAIRRMSYASNGTLYTTDDSGTVCLWKLRIKHFHGGPAQCVCIPHGSLKGHTSIVIAFAEVHRYGYFVTGGMDSQILLWDLETSRRKGALIKHKRAVSHLQYSKSMDLLLSGGYEHEIYCWDVYNKQIVLVLTGHHHPCIGLQLTYLSADDEQEHAVSCDASGTMKLWKLTRTASGEAAARQTFVADPDNGLYKPRMMLACGPRRVITASRELRLFEAKSTYVQDFLPFKALFNSVLDRFYVAIGKYIQVWCAVAGDMIDEWYHVSDSEISCMCFDDRERKVVFGNVNGRVIVLNAINGAIMKNVHLAEIAPSAALTGHLSAPMDAAQPRAASDIAVNQIHYNKEDKCLIVLTSRSVFIFDEDATEEKADGVLLPLFRVAFDMHEYEITASAFSYELSLIATGSADKSIRIWEFQQLRLEGECIGHTGQVTAMSFVESYPLLVSADEDANLSIWTVRPSPRPYMRVVSVLCRSPRVRAAEGAQVHLPDAGVSEASRNNNAEANMEQDATRRRTSTTATGKNVSIAEGVETLNISPKHGSFRRRLNRRATVGSSKNLRIYFPSEDFDPVPVCCLEIQRSENGITLYTGDQRGDMKEWNLGLCLKDLGSEPLDPEKLPPSFEGYNASRHVELSYRYLFEDFDGFRADEQDNDTSGPEVEETRRQKMLERKERKRRQERMRQKLLRIRKNIKSSETKIKARLPVLKLFAAHAENINSMQVIAMPESILTTSMDGNVRIWNHAGKRIGNLSMSANEVANVQKGLAKNVAYRFNLDIDAKLWDRYDEAIRILQSVRAKYSLPRLLTRQTLAIRSPPEIDIDVHMRAEKFSGEIVRLGNTRVAKALALLLLADGQHREGRDAFDIDFTQTLDHHEMTAGILDTFLEDIQEALEFVSASTEISRDSSRSSRSDGSDNDRSSHKDQMFFSETFREMGGHPSRATLNMEDGESLFQDIPETAEDSPTKGDVASIPDYRRRSMARVSFLMQDQQSELSQDASDSSLKTAKSGRHQRNLDGSIENVRRPSRQSILRRATLVSESRTSVISAATQRSMQRRRESTIANPNGPLLSGANSSNIGIYSKREILSHKILFDQMSDPSGKLVELEVLMDNVDKLGVDVEQLASMFDTLDTDGNGSISFSEMLRMFFVGASAEDLRAMEDFIEATYNNTEDNCNPVMTPADRKELRELFRLYDKDRGGTLSLIELFEVLNKREYKPRDQFGSDEDLLFSFADLERLTKKFNFTLDHELSEDEFIELMFDFQHTDVDYKS
ncbi:WD repeat-containing protein wdr-5.1 [Hondaea fermentalgiana]|uniref:WD repeat-containing protein wdr-5.1 n=1 Tax=Hondaea fermentalgiana TaxID=2315210 RepID=A0A2R5GJG9_9STRA|nr:WD repeat-containing protein wdr-5.1 [Hondaea fermentalgiana]|eukprot:GBG28004.1 WD repeat-containing protein wdr-5.1 [Hondaea fermentalgiana]